MNGREIIVRRVAKLFERGAFVNLGAGIPVGVKDHIEKSQDIVLFSENGVVGATVREADAPYDRYSTDAGELPVSFIPGGSIVDSATAFGLIRGGHLDVTVLGAMQVDREGSLANWTVPGGKLVGMGGAMDLIVGAKKVIVATEHTTKKGDPKILEKCTFPLTGYRVVSEVVTELAYFEVEGGNLVLRELAPGVGLEEVREKTGSEFIVAEDLCEMPL